MPAHWMWSPYGFLYKLGAVDIAGSGAVHLVGGSSAFVAAWLLGPRLGRWDLDGAPPMGSPTNALVGLFMLWWGWLAFNSGRYSFKRFLMKKTLQDTIFCKLEV